MRTFTLRAVADAFVQYVLVTFAVNGFVTPDVLVHTNGVLAAMLIVSSGAPEEFVFSVNAPSLRMKIDFSDAVVNTMLTSVVADPVAEKSELISPSDETDCDWLTVPELVATENESVCEIAIGHP